MKYFLCKSRLGGSVSLQNFQGKKSVIYWGYIAWGTGTEDRGFRYGNWLICTIKTSVPSLSLNQLNLPLTVLDSKETRRKNRTVQKTKALRMDVIQETLDKGCCKGRECLNQFSTEETLHWQSGLWSISETRWRQTLYPSHPIFPIYFIGSYKTPIMGQKLLYFL